MRIEKNDSGETNLHSLDHFYFKYLIPHVLKSNSIIYLL